MVKNLRVAGNFSSYALAIDIRYVANFMHVYIYSESYCIISEFFRRFFLSPSPI